MKKLIGMKILAIALVLTSLATDSLAQTRIRFVRGRSAATVNGSLASGATRQYTLSVSENQSMTIQVTSGNNKIQIDVDDVHGHIDYYEDGYAQLTTDANGDHSITLKNQGGRATTFTMTVSVR